MTQPTAARPDGPRRVATGTGATSRSPPSPSTATGRARTPTTATRSARATPSATSPRAPGRPSRRSRAPTPSADAVTDPRSARSSHPDRRVRGTGRTPRPRRLAATVTYTVRLGRHRQPHRRPLRHHRRRDRRRERARLPRAHPHRPDAHRPGRRDRRRAGTRAAAPRRPPARSPTRSAPATPSPASRAKHGTTVAAIVAANGLDSRALIRIGQTLTVPVPVAAPAPAPSGSTFAGRTYSDSVVGAANANLATLGALGVPSKATMQAKIAATARAMGVDPALAQAVAFQESGFNHAVVSPANAIGTMQVIPSRAPGRPTSWAASSTCVDPDDNVTAGVAILRALVQQRPRPADGDRRLLPGRDLGAEATACSPTRDATSPTSRRT